MRARRVLSRVTLPIWCLALCCAGCAKEEGPPRASVSGTVTYKGKTVNEGAITFRPIAGSAAAAGEIKDGKFEISEEAGPGIGRHKVGVASKEVTEKGLPTLPLKFFQRPSVEVEIQAGHNEVTIELRD